MAKIKSTGLKTQLPPMPKAGATAKQINANTKQVRKAISKKEKEIRARAAAKEALKKNKEVRREFSKVKAAASSRKKSN